VKRQRTLTARHVQWRPAMERTSRRREGRVLRRGGAVRVRGHHDRDPLSHGLICTPFLYLPCRTSSAPCTVTASWTTATTRSVEWVLAGRIHCMYGATPNRWT
jgi:hypothetical protein